MVASCPSKRDVAVASRTWRDEALVVRIGRKLSLNEASPRNGGRATTDGSLALHSNRAYCLPAQGTKRLVPFAGRCVLAA